MGESITANSESNIAVIALHKGDMYGECRGYAINENIRGFRVIDTNTWKIKDVTYESVIQNLSSIKVGSIVHMYTHLMKGRVLYAETFICLKNRDGEGYYIVNYKGEKWLVDSNTADMLSDTFVYSEYKERGSSYLRKMASLDTMNKFIYSEIDDMEDDARYLVMQAACRNDELETHVHSITLKSGQVLDTVTGKIMTLKKATDTCGIGRSCTKSVRWLMLDRSFYPIRPELVINTERSLNAAAFGKRAVLIRKNPYRIKEDINSIEFYVGIKRSGIASYDRIEVMTLSSIISTDRLEEGSFAENTIVINEKQGYVMIKTLVSSEYFELKRLFISSERTDAMEKAENINNKMRALGGIDKYKVDSRNVISSYCAKDGGVETIPEGLTVGYGAFDDYLNVKLKKLVLKEGSSIEKGTLLPYCIEEIELHGAKAYRGMLRCGNTNKRFGVITVGSDISALDLHRMLKKFIIYDVNIKVRGDIEHDKAKKIVQMIAGRASENIDRIYERMRLHNIRQRSYMFYNNNAAGPVHGKISVLGWCTRAGNENKRDIKEALCGRDIAFEISVHGIKNILEKQQMEMLGALMEVSENCRNAVENYTYTIERHTEILETVYKRRDVKITDLIKKEYTTSCNSYFCENGKRESKIGYFDLYHTDMPGVYCYILSRVKYIGDNTEGYENEMYDSEYIGGIVEFKLKADEIPRPDDSGSEWE